MGFCRDDCSRLCSAFNPLDDLCEGLGSALLLSQNGAVHRQAFNPIDLVQRVDDPGHEFLEIRIGREAPKRLRCPIIRWCKHRSINIGKRPDPCPR